MSSKRIAKVVVPVRTPLDKGVFDYEVPEKMRGQIKEGQLVQVSFRGKKTEGVVFALTQKSEFKKLSKIEEIADPIPYFTEEMIKLAHWISEYYFAPLGLVVKAMLPPRMKRVSKKIIKKESEKGFGKVRLTAEQKKIIQEIQKSKQTTSLIFGVTASGKTEVYLRLIEDIIKKGKQVIVLVPEISLTPQAVGRYTARFGPNKVAVLHSALAKGEYFNEWERIRKKEAAIAIGPRSALFAPVRDLGLIVIDEEHDGSYKQWDQTPRYQAREAAIKYAELTGAKVVLGSATPSVETYYRGQNDNLSVYSLSKSIQARKLKTGNHKFQKTLIVDMREELKKGNFSVLSEELQGDIKETLAKKKQVLLFLNRRGAATFVMCRDCGQVQECPHCQVPLVYHFAAYRASGSALMCHHCGTDYSVPTRCPKCQSLRIKYFGTGTQKVEAEIFKRFPLAKIARMDRDTTQKKGAHGKIYQSFAKGDIDVLVGTQMISKGWDFPRVGLVGIISGDTVLNLPDFRAAERTFQMITQVAGRTGRGGTLGKVIIQTYNPDHFAVLAAATRDFPKFYSKEIEARRELAYPPFSTLVHLIGGHRDGERLKAEARDLVSEIKNIVTDSQIDLVGPSPMFIPKIREKCRYHLAIKVRKNFSIVISKLRPIFEKLPSHWMVDVDPASLL